MSNAYVENDLQYRQSQTLFYTKKVKKKKKNSSFGSISFRC